MASEYDKMFSDRYSRVREAEAAEEEITRNPDGSVSFSGGIFSREPIADSNLDWWNKGEPSRDRAPVVSGGSGSIRGSRSSLTSGLMPSGGGGMPSSGGGMTGYFPKEVEQSGYSRRIAPDRPTPTYGDLPVYEKPTMGEMPEFEVPERDKARVEALTQQQAAPGVRNLREAIRMTMAQPSGSVAQQKETLRGALSGFGQGLENVMAGARRGAEAQYEREYQPELEKERRTYETGVGQTREEFREEAGRRRAEYQTAARKREMQFQSAWSDYLQGYGTTSGTKQASGFGDYEEMDLTGGGKSDFSESHKSKVAQRRAEESGRNYSRGGYDYGGGGHGYGY